MSFEFAVFQRLTSPTVVGLGFDPVWFGVLFMVNMQMAYLTPPFGACLFFMKGVAPPSVSMSDIYGSIAPFLALQAIGLVIVILFPEIVLWLPRMLIS